MRQLMLPMLIWDLPTRLFHWVLVVLVGTAWLSAELNWMSLHVLCGMTIMSLVLFRLIWGFIGSDTARFVYFVKRPAEAIRHLTRIAARERDTETGHNAAGGWMVLAMLGLLSIQVVTGLCADDDVMTKGPLALTVGAAWSGRMTQAHHISFFLLQILVLLHVLAIVAYRVLKGQNLLSPMITGKKRLPGATVAPRMMHPVVGAVVYAVSAILVGVFAWVAY